MTGAKLDLLWKPPGPVAARFMASMRQVQILNGPIGSGKTTAALMKLITLAQRQAPSTTQSWHGKPVRRFKVCVVRDTYRMLWKTTLPSWWERVPRDVGEFVGAENAPARHSVAFGMADGSVVDFTAEFVAIGENSVEDILRGYQVTAFYLNEADLLAREVYTYARSRHGRYPSMQEGGPSWDGIVMDCNAPEFDSWMYEDFFTKTPAEMDDIGVDLFRQPSALSPQAENTENLRPGYYENQRKGQPEWFVARMLENKPGYSRAGKPIFPEFNDTLHVAPQALEPLAGVPLDIGLDAGLNPAAVFAQRLPNGQWRIVDELVGESGTGAKRFGDMLAQRLHERFGVCRTIHAHADPSAAYGADTQAGEATWIEIVANATRIPVRGAPTNKPIARWEAVRRPLSRLIDGAPGLLLSPSCKMLRGGFNSGYRFRAIAGSAGKFSEEADKNAYSHPHDALQYVLSGGGEDIEIRDRGAAHRQRLESRRAQHEWEPFSRAE